MCACLCVYAHTHTHCTDGILGCEPRSRDETPGGPEESRWTKSQSRYTYICICVQSTHVYIYTISLFHSVIPQNLHLISPFHSVKCNWSAPSPSGLPPSLQRQSLYSVSPRTFVCLFVCRVSIYMLGCFLGERKVLARFNSICIY